MNRGMVPYYFFVLGTVMCTIYGQIVMKWRIGRYGLMPDGFLPKIGFLLKLFLDPYIVSGLFAAFLASLFWMAAVTKLDLSAAYPLITAGLTVITVLLAIVLLKEPLSMSKVLGVSLIVSGVIVMIRDTA